MSEQKAVKLTATQQELLTALQNGIKVYYMPYMGTFNPNAYFLREDTNRRCSAPAQALIDKGLAKSVGDWRSKELFLIGKE